ncbi:hypothetical protein pb186bvf_013588 [Paramecium bursaria]
MAKQFYLIIGQEKRIKLKRKSYILGRKGSTTDIQIKNPNLSRQHCQLIVGKSSITIRDLGSTNGTFVGEKEAKVNQLLMIKKGMVITLGDSVQIEIDHSEIDSDESLSVSQERQPKQIIQKSDRKQQKIWQLGGLNKEKKQMLKNLMGAKDISDDEEKNDGQIDKRNKDLELQYKRALMQNKYKSSGIGF